MPDEITPDAPPDPPAVTDTAPDTDTVFPGGLPTFDESAPPYAAEPPVAVNGEGATLDQQHIANLQLINMKLDELIARSDSVIGRIDWIAPRVEWIRATFSALVEQFGKITPGQVFSMLRGKGGAMPPVPGQQEGSPQP